jgi:mono/diheme cytochrome c family protein
LKELYKRPKLMSGQPVNDETVAAKIRQGGPRMPAYQHTLNAKDMADLLAYLREKCCWDADHPPANPRYKAQ